MTLQILILAAGSARRMRGTDKVLELVGGQPQIRRIAMAALSTGCPVVVALPPDRPRRRAALAGLALTALTVPDAALGMGVTLREAAAALPAGPLMILLADLVEISADDLHSVIAAHAANPTAILRGCCGATPGHPTVIPADLRADLLTLTGDEGARALITRHRDRLHLVALPEGHATTDLDTPEDWAAWRALRRQ